MPELPEVQATVDYLRERTEGQTISSASVLWHRTVASIKPKVFEQRLANSSISQLFRRGKFIGFKLSQEGSLYLFVHLRMSGSLDVVSSSLPVDKHDRVVIYLKNGKSLRFNDTRKFGRMYLTSSPDQVIGSLGPEPLSDQFSLEYLTQLTSSRKSRIKPLLLNQALIAGLGNIYVDECLWKQTLWQRRMAAGCGCDDTDGWQARWASCPGGFAAVLEAVIYF
jgi:formamidopyrimidine-DNA glycosylase